MVPIKNKSPESVREAYPHWLRFFGPTKNVALDLGREFEGSFALRAETDRSFIDPSSAEWNPPLKAVSPKGMGKPSS